MNTFTRLHKDNTIQGGDGQRQAGKARKKEKEKEKKENKDVLMS
jgi:cyclophilin family peptidyl-prolyl cis-trans isomerase